MKHPITQTRNGIDVYVDLVHSAAAAHIAAQPYLLGLVREALEKTKASAKDLRIEKDMGRSVGYDFIAETSAGDTVFYARRAKAAHFTRFVKNGKPMPTNYLSMILHRAESGELELIDTWVGCLSPPAPGSDNETSESRPYWDTHALVFDRQPLQAHTITKICPY